MENLETLLLAVTSRLNVLRHHPSFPDPEVAPDRDALNCVRVLTRILPFVYEAENLAEWEERFFWGTRRRKVKRAQATGEVLFDESQTDDGDTPEPRPEEYEEAKPLAEELIDNLIDLLFFNDFTIPQQPNSHAKVTYAIWQSGVGCKTSIGTSKEMESNRSEILRLLLTLTSRSMYMSPTILPVQGVRAITYIATCSDKQIVLSVLCSLLNTVIKHNTASWRLPYDHMVWRDSRQSLVIYSLHLLLVLLLYPIPENGRGPAPKNFYRHFLGRLHRPEDFQFLAEGMTRVLSQPMQATTSYLPGSQKSVQWAPEMMMLFWEVLQCNKRFRSFIIESNRAHDFVILMLFYAIEYKNDPSRQGIVRMCVFVLQTMSVEPMFGKNLNKKFEAQDTLPQSIRLANFRGTYADFLIISIHSLITTSKGKLDAIYPALLAIINNIAAYAKDLSMSTSSKLLQLFASMASPTFLLANETNHDLLQSLLESINAIIEHQYRSNANLIYAVLRSRRRIEALRAFTLDGAHQELERAERRRKETAAGISSIDSVADLRRSGSNLGTLQSPGPINSPPMSTAETDHGAFTIGDDEDDSDDDHNQPTPSQSSTRESRAPSVASSSAAAEEVPTQLRGMSEKARGKMPVSAQSFSRQNSAASISYSAIASPNPAGFTASPEWLETWLPELPLHTLITLTKTLAPRLPQSSSTSPSNSGQHSPELIKLLADLPDTANHPSIAPVVSSASPIRIHLFEWSALSLGWYTSVLWSLIFSSEMMISPSTASTTSQITNTVTAGALGSGNGIGPIGVWNGTNIKLFRVEVGVADGPMGQGKISLSQPRGAVDAVGTRLVQGVQGLGLGNVWGRLGGNGNSNGSRQASLSGTEDAQRSIREV